MQQHPPFTTRLIITAITAFVSSSVMSFTGVALNYGFHPGFASSWFRMFIIGYALLVPLLLVLLPLVQRTVVALSMRKRRTA